MRKWLLFLMRLGGALLLTGRQCMSRRFRVITVQNTLSPRVLRRSFTSNLIQKAGHANSTMKTLIWRRQIVDSRLGREWIERSLFLVIVESLRVNINNCFLSPNVKRRKARNLKNGK